MVEAILIIIVGIFLFLLIFLKAVQYECGIHTYKSSKKITPTYTVITVKNNEDCIEGVLYNQIKKMCSNNAIYSSTNILVIDLGSCDDTLKILKKISNKYEFIHILNCNTYVDMVNV